MENNFFSALTKKQKNFYETLRKYIKDKGVSPTVTELKKMLKLSSPRAVTQYLEALERKGLILRSRYEARGIRLNENSGVENEVVNIPVIASAGCDNMSVMADRTYDEYICVAREMLDGLDRKNIVSIKAIGDSMTEAGINENDYVLVELTQAVQDNDLVVAIIDGFAVIKKIEFANNAVILKPVSSDPQYRPIIVRKDFRIFGKVVDIIRRPQKGDIEVVPLYIGIQ
jgi:repressor LexA